MAMTLSILATINAHSRKKRSEENLEIKRYLISQQRPLLSNCYQGDFKYYEICQQGVQHA